MVGFTDFEYRKPT